MSTEKPVLPHLKMDPLCLDLDAFRILPQDLWGMTCKGCRRAISKWLDVVATEVSEVPQGICAFCVLYESEWGILNHNRLARLLDFYNKSTMSVIELDESGKILKVEDADKVLASAAAVSVFYLGASKGPEC